MAGLRLGILKLLRCRADGSVFYFFCAATVVVHWCGAIFTIAAAAAAAAFPLPEIGEGGYLARPASADIDVCRLISFSCDTPRIRSVSCGRETVRAENERGVVDQAVGVPKQVP